MKNPYVKNGEWFWFDESYNEYGPYESKEEANIELTYYCETQLKPKEIINEKSA